MNRVQLDVLDTGYCVARSSLVVRGTGWREIRCHAPAFLLRHPQYGVILFDTGYAPRLRDAFARWPARLYHYATPATFGTPVVEGLRARGIPADAVRTLIVSHLHADHVAGLRDFPVARFVVSHDALALQQRVRGMDAIRRGIIPELFPDDFAARAHVVHAFGDAVLPYLGATHDLCGDGSIRLMPLPGHARGQIGALVRTDVGEVLLCADGAWVSRAYRELRTPHGITALMQDDFAALRTTLERIQRFALDRPDVVILPTHCPETLTWRVEGVRA